MNNLEMFADTFQKTWVGLREQRKTYEKKVSAIEKYRGSAGYEREKKEAEKAYHDNVKSIQQQAYEELGGCLKAMRSKVASTTMDIPSPESLRLLEVLGMRENLSSDDLERAAETLKGSDTAMQVLSDLAARHGKIVPTDHKSHEQQRRDAYDALSGAVLGLCNWDGADGDTVRREWTQNRNPWGGGDRSQLNDYAFDAARVADFDGMEFEKSAMELSKQIVGERSTWEAVRDLG